MYARKEMQQMERDKEAEVIHHIWTPIAHSAASDLLPFSPYCKKKVKQSMLQLQREAVWEAEVAEQEQKEAPRQLEQKQVPSHHLSALYGSKTYHDGIESLAYRALTPKHMLLKSLGNTCCSTVTAVSEV